MNFTNFLDRHNVLNLRSDHRFQWLGSVLHCSNMFILVTSIQEFYRYVRGSTEKSDFQHGNSSTPTCSPISSFLFFICKYVIMDHKGKQT